MNTKFALSMALGLAGASTLMASTVDVYITGSTAFRANVFTACTNLYAGGPSAIYFADSAHGGSSSGASAGSWVMTGNPVSTLTNLQGNTMVIHGLFTGSIQGLQSVESHQPLIWAQPHGVAGGAADTYVTNSPTIAFSDSASAACPFVADSSTFNEEQVAVQPFVVAKSFASSGAVTNISNVSWEQLNYGIPNGRIPLSAWTGGVNDTNTFVYIMERTKDSGTRRTETAGEGFEFNDPVTVYIYDYTNNFFYAPTVLNATSMGASPNGVVGPVGNNNANLAWGYGYVGGGDIKNSLNSQNPANQAIAVLSMADSKGVGAGNWSNVVSYDGLWPTTAGSGIHNNTGTNDYSPIIRGYYPIWGYEVLIYDFAAQYVDQDITLTQLGTQTTPGSFMGVFNAQTAINGGAPIVGSIEREIDLTKPNGATAIPLVDMVNARAAVGGVISPPFN